MVQIETNTATITTNVEAHVKYSCINGNYEESATLVFVVSVLKTSKKANLRSAVQVLLR